MKEDWRTQLITENVAEDDFYKVFRFVEDLITWKKDVLSSYCMTKCKTSCCDFGESKLKISDLTEDQLREIFGLGLEDDIDRVSLGVPIISTSFFDAHWGDMFDRGFVLGDSKGRYSLNHFDTCPAYYKGLCAIHDGNRYIGCEAFPIDLAKSPSGEFGLMIWTQKCSAVRDLDLTGLLRKCAEADLPAFHLRVPKNGGSQPDLERIYDF